MNQLARIQGDFLACLLDDEAPLPAGWDTRRAAGMAVYRNAYRTRLIDVLRNTFERTERLVGDKTFTQAAAHHLITHPPGSWTIDLAGKGFAETCIDLFAKDADVGELAWLEWALHCAFTAADGVPMTLVNFATMTAEFDVQQWDGLCLALMPGTALRKVTFDVAELWRELGDPSGAYQARALDAPKWLLVWREAELPTFSLMDFAEGQALADIQRGIPFGQACADALDNATAPNATEMAGTMLQHWIGTGLIQTIRSSALPAF